MGNNCRYSMSKKHCEPYGRPGPFGGKFVGVFLATLNDLKCMLYSIFHLQWSEWRHEMYRPKVKNKYISFSMTLLIQTICNGCSCGFINYSKNI
jgi:hypothetical protein